MKGTLRRRAVLLLPALALLLAAVCLSALKIGQAPVTWSELLHILTGGQAGEPSATARRIVVGLRLPRVLFGLSVGASLAAAGVVFQAILRNPLADPYLLGLSGGASLGAALVLLSGVMKGTTLALPAAAFLGALLALLAVMKISQLSRAPGPTTLILAGVMVGALCTALVMLLTSISPSARVHGALLWMMGSLASPAPGILPPVLAVATLGVCGLALAAHHLNALSLGEEVAQQIGADASRLRWRFLFTGALMTAAAVAAGGLIGFIGLVVPHALRTTTGADHRLLLPASALAGGAVLVLADSGARTLVPPAEIPVGVITALFGAPFFLFLLVRSARWMK